MIVRLELPPGEVLYEKSLQERLGIGRTPVREALQRLTRDQLVAVIPRRGTFVASIDVSDLPLLYETRAVLEPYAARLAAVRGNGTHWADLRAILDEGSSVDDQRLMLEVDHRCHEITWAASGNRFLIDTLDVLYAQSDRVWHMYLADVADMRHALDQHAEILHALERGDGDQAADLVEAHVLSFDHQVRSAVTARLAPPLDVLLPEVDQT